MRPAKILDIIKHGGAMLKFPCNCGHLFNVTDDQAGRQIQCPLCGRLNDVPSIDDLASLDRDGTYRLDSTPSAPDPDRLSRLQRVYARDKQDENGQDIDLRKSLNAPGNPSVQPLDLKEEPPSPPRPAPMAPKYDPETGELIRPMEVQALDPIHSTDLPFAKPAISYADVDLTKDTNLLRPMIELLMPGNVAAMFFVFLTHLFLNLIFFTMVLTTFWLLSLAILFLGGALAAHYSNVIEEIGVERLDELPRFLRHFSISDDLFRPFVNFMLALGFCFGPAIIVWQLLGSFHAVQWISFWTLGIIGGFLFPAALLTTTTSGTILNLRPDRLLGTIRIIGARYMWFLILLAATLFVYGLGNRNTIIHAENLSSIIGNATKAGSAANTPANSFLVHGAPSYTILAAGIYVMHLFLWYLSLAYRVGHEKFPWILQRHHRDPSRDAGPRRPSAESTTEESPTPAPATAPEVVNANSAAARARLSQTAPSRRGALDRMR